MVDVALVVILEDAVSDAVLLQLRVKDAVGVMELVGEFVGVTLGCGGMVKQNVQSSAPTRVASVYVYICKYNRKKIGRIDGLDVNTVGSRI